MLIISYIATALLVCGIILTSHPQEYLYIEIQKHENGTIIGRNTSPIILNSSTYNFINSTLYIQKGIELNSSIKAIFGSEFEISGDTESSISSKIYPIVKLPYNPLGISITKIEGDNITLDCYGSNITIIKGSSWKNVTNRTNKIDDRYVSITTTIAVYNHGHVPVIAW